MIALETRARQRRRRKTRKKKKLLVFTTALAVMTGPVGYAGAETGFAWREEEAVLIRLEGDAATIARGEGAVAEGSLVSIQAPGTYILRGTLDDGQIRIQTGPADRVTLVLDGAHVTSTTTAPVDARGTGQVILVLASGSGITLAGAGSDTGEGQDGPDAALSIEGDLTIGGEGRLTVSAPRGRGIAAGGHLAIEAGEVSIAAGDDAIRARDSLSIHGGTLALDAGGDGIKASGDGGPEEGWIAIDGGNLTITAAGDGIQAESSLALLDGTLAITATGEGKGLKAGSILEIAGGEADIEAGDDAIHSGGVFLLSAGTLTLAAGGDAIHADEAITVSGGDLLITRCEEGLEAAVVTISGGSVTASATDDVLNAAGEEESSEDYHILISGGVLRLSTTDGDGIDSNGRLTITGGDIVVQGSSAGGNGALDADGTITLDGGQVIAADTGDMPALPGDGSAQPYLAVRYDSPLAEGEAVTLAAPGGEVLAVFVPDKATHRMVMFSVAGLTPGETYTVTTDGGVRTTVTLEGMGTYVSQAGEAVQGGGFGGRGGMPPPREGGRGEGPGGQRPLDPGDTGAVPPDAADSI